VPVTKPEACRGSVGRHARVHLRQCCRRGRVHQRARGGLAPIERLLAAPADAVMADVMDSDPPMVAPGTHQEQAAWLASKRAEPNLAVAYFIPGIVYLADAVGTQAETLAIRGLSVGVGIGRIARREALTGLLVGSVATATGYR
jgi:Mg/Co/Ni transporter MgtE